MVRSRSGFWSSLHIGAAFTIGVGTLFAAGVILMEHGVGFTFFIALVIGGGGVVLGLSVVTLRLQIGLGHIEKRDLWGVRSVAWIDVSEVQVNPTYFGSFVIVIFTRNKERRLSIMLPFIGNRREVAQAVLEAATASSPSVVVKAPLGTPYGRPPYGIFTSQESGQ